MSTLFALNEVRNWPHYFEKVLVRSFPSKDFFVDGGGRSRGKKASLRPRPKKLSLNQYGKRGQLQLRAYFFLIIESFLCLLISKRRCFKIKRNNGQRKREKKSTPHDLPLAFFSCATLEVLHSASHGRPAQLFLRSEGGGHLSINYTSRF